MTHGGIQVAEFELQVRQLVIDLGIAVSTRQLGFIFCDGFPVSAEAAESKAEMVVAERNFRIEPQRGLELLQRLQGAIRVLIGAAEKEVRQRGTRIDAQCLLQLIRGGRVLLLIEQHQRQVVMSIEVARLKLDRALQLCDGLRAVSSFHVRQAEIMRELGILRPSGNRCRTRAHSIRAALRFQIREQESGVRRLAGGEALHRALENSRSARKFFRAQRLLPLLDQHSFSVLRTSRDSDDDENNQERRQALTATAHV